jgi:hypothetical protein
MFEMAVFPEFVAAFVLIFPLLSGPAIAGSLADIEHVVLFMQGTSLFPFDANNLLMTSRK